MSLNFVSRLKTRAATWVAMPAEVTVNLISKPILSFVRMEQHNSFK